MTEGVARRYGLVVITRLGPIEDGGRHGRLLRCLVLVVPLAITLLGAFPLVARGDVTADLVFGGLGLLGLGWFQLPKSVRITSSEVEVINRPKSTSAHVARSNILGVTLVLMQRAGEPCPALVTSDELIPVAPLAGKQRKRTDGLASNLADVLGVPLMEPEEAAATMGIATDPPPSEVHPSLVSLGIQRWASKAEGRMKAVLVVAVLAAFFGVGITWPWAVGEQLVPDLDRWGTASSEAIVILDANTDYGVWSPVSGFDLFDLEAVGPDGALITIDNQSPVTFATKDGDPPTVDHDVAVLSVDREGGYQIRASLGPAGAAAPTLSGPIPLWLGDPPGNRDQPLPVVGLVPLVGGLAVLLSWSSLRARWPYGQP